MEVGMSLNQLVRLPLSSKGRAHEKSLIMRHSVFPTKTTTIQKPYQQRKNRLMVVEAKCRMKGKPARFDIFIRMANVHRWYPLVIPKDNFLGKHIYKDTLARDLAVIYKVHRLYPLVIPKENYEDTLARDLAAVIYKDEKKVRKMAVKQYSVLQSATEFRYGYKIFENNDLEAAQAANDVIELPRLDQRWSLYLWNKLKKNTEK